MAVQLATRRFTGEGYCRMAEAGRVELIEGEIIETAGEVLA